MKRMILIVLMAIMMTGCGATVDRETQSETSRFVELERTSRWMVVADKKTGVMYSVSNGVYNTGTFTLLVDENGKPLVWEGESNE
jgi:uncharacterized protein YceK